MVDGKPTVVGWIVDSRSVQGSVSGDLSGASTFTYGGILDNLQSGSMQGTLVIASGQGVLYLAASGEIATAVIGLYEFGEIVAWCGGVGYPVSAFLSQMYNAAELGLLPDGELSFEQLQAWCTAIGMTTGQFFAGLAGDPSLADYPDEVIGTLYGTALPILSGLQILGGMYGDSLPPLPKTLSAEFSGTLRVDAGTGIYSGVNGQGKFGPYNRQPLILSVSPDQHVESVEGAIALSGTYDLNKPFSPRELNREKLGKLIQQWKDRFGEPGNVDRDGLREMMEQWKDRYGRGK
jgi:hypothetical protein